MAIITFKSKTEVFQFLGDIRRYVSASVVPLPKEMKVGCMLAVQESLSSAPTAYYLVKGGRYPTFSGIFSVKKSGNRKIINRMY